MIRNTFLIAALGIVFNFVASLEAQAEERDDPAPARCFRMARAADGGINLSVSKAIDLCGDSKNAEQTTACFKAARASDSEINLSSDDAILLCKSR